MSGNSVPVEITEAAGDWLDRVLIGDMSEHDRDAFTGWALRSPVHVEEFLRVSEIRAELSASFARQPVWVSAVLERADTNVLPLHDERPDKSLNDTGRSRRGWLYAAAGIAVLAFGGWFALWQGPATLDPSSITTAVGEQRSVLLSDGSTVQLNTDSSVRIRLTAAVREIRLLRGEALFDVAKDPNRPFRVISDDVVVQAIGTRFNVYRRDRETRITVVEGRVAVNRELEEAQDAPSAGASPPSRTGKGIELAAGMQVAVAVDDERALAPAPANLVKATAWTERRLVFEDQTVAAIVAEFNRYNRERLLIGDPALGKRRLTGVFDANDPDEFIALLSSLEAIDVRLTGNGHRELFRADAPANE